MSRTGHRYRKTRQQAARKFHDTITQELFKNPSILKIDGLTSESVIWAATEYHYMCSRYHREDGMYERSLGPDLVFFYYDNVLRFLVVEVKGSLLGRSHTDIDKQIGRARSYFRQRWKSVIINQIKQPLLRRMGEFSDTDVFLSLSEVTREFGSIQYKILFYYRDIYLGKVRSIKEKVYFN